MSRPGLFLLMTTCLAVTKTCSVHEFESTYLIGTMSINIQIRPLTSQEQAFLWDMLHEAIYVPEGQDACAREVIQQPSLACYAQNWGRLGDVGFIAVGTANDQLIGAVWLRLLVGQNRGYGYVDDATPELSMALLPHYRAQGIGTRLLGHLLVGQRARSPISLSVSVGNPARRLYERFGFETVSQSGTSLVMLRKGEG